MGLSLRTKENLFQDSVNVTRLLKMYVFCSAFWYKMYLKGFIDIYVHWINISEEINLLHVHLHSHQRIKFFVVLKLER